MKILVVEDDKEFSNGLREHLSFQKHFVEVASTLKEASEFLDKSSFNLMLLDYRLGMENGLEILNKLKCYTQSPVVVLMTSYATKEIAIKSLNYGVFKLLEKPFLPHSIDEILNEIDVNRHKSKINLVASGHLAIEDGNEVELTELEYKILSFLLENQNQLVTKSELHRYVYSSDIKARNALNTHLTNLKSKLSTNFTKQLKTIRSKGYILETDS